LKKWFENHLEHPYPTEEERVKICEKTGLTRKQLRVWLINSRKRKLEKSSDKNLLKTKKVKKTRKHSTRKTVTIEKTEESAPFTRMIETPPPLPMKKNAVKKMSMLDVLIQFTVKANAEYNAKLTEFYQQLQSY